MASWWKPAWTLAEETLRGMSEALQRKLRFVRQLRALLAVAIVGTYVAVVGAVVWPEQLRFFVALMGISLSAGLVYWHLFISTPLQARSIVRLIDQGYPGNVRELAIRAAARKLHEESIETEELLVETAWNEGKKAYRRFQERADKLRQDLDREEAADPPQTPKD